MGQKQSNTIKKSGELEFAIFCIENISARLGRTQGMLNELGYFICV